MTMEKFKDEMAMSFFGRSAILAKAGSQCVSCGKAADQFRDKLSEKEYGISGLCQRCQDEVFCEDPRDED